MTILGDLYTRAVRAFNTESKRQAEENARLSELVAASAMQMQDDNLTIQNLLQEIQAVRSTAEVLENQLEIATIATKNAQSEAIRLQMAFDALKASQRPSGATQSPDAHFLNNLWPGFWLFGTLIPVWRYPDCPVGLEEIRRVCGILNALAPEVTGGKRRAFFRIEDTYAQTNKEIGILLFGVIPDWAKEPGNVKPSDYYLSVQTKWSRRGSPDTPPVAPLAEAHYRYPLEIRAPDYGEKPFLHELLHALGLADHYWSLGEDGKEGLYTGEGTDSIMANPELGIRPHDLADMTAFYSQCLVRGLG